MRRGGTGLLHQSETLGGHVVLLLASSERAIEILGPAPIVVRPSVWTSDGVDADEALLTSERNAAEPI